MLVPIVISGVSSISRKYNFFLDISKPYKIEKQESWYPTKISGTFYDEIKQLRGNNAYGFYETPEELYAMIENFKFQNKFLSEIEK